MAAFTYSKLSGKNDPMYGKYEHPIKALIESESDALEKNKSLLDVLYNIEKSNRYAETVIGQSDFDTFQSTLEGQRAENDSVETTYKKTIEHIPFMKEFTITKEMLDDAQFGMGSNMKNAPKAFTRAYYKTRVKLGEQALINGASANFVFNKAKVDLTTGDGLPLFSGVHTYAKKSMKGTQSNYYWENGMFKTSGVIDTAKVEAFLNKAANKLRNFKDENGEVMEYVADIVCVPGNRPELEAAVKKACGSERTVGTNNNDINTQYGNWTVVVIPNWQTTDDRLIVMSSEANKNLMGNMFYNRVPLDISNEIDIHTRDFIWNGYCRFGVGFTTWKHCLLAVDATSAPGTATAF